MILTLFSVLLLLLINNSVSSDNNNQATINTTCLDLVIANGNVTLENSDVQFVHIQCHASYDLIGPAKMECIEGQWRPSFLSQCAARCHPPPFIWNGGFQIEGEKTENGLFKKGALVTYSCSPGFYLTPLASKYRMCKDSLWTGEDAYCQPPGCKQPEPIKNGYYVRENIEVTGEFGIDERLHYSCSNGYALTGPSTQKCLSDGSWSPKIPPKCAESRKLFSIALQC